MNNSRFYSIQPFIFALLGGFNFIHGLLSFVVLVLVGMFIASVIDLL